jgi:PAS domain S-box-containing protein
MIYLNLEINMKKDNPNKTKLTTSAKIKKLQEKIVEMEQTLSSIRSGKVDALVIDNNNNIPSIHTLKGADEPYRILIENISEGALTVTEEGIIIHCNKLFCDLIKFSDNELMDTPLANYLPMDQRPLLGDLLNQAKKNVTKSEFNLIASDNTIVTVLLSCQLLKFGKINSISVVVTDITEIKAVQLETFLTNERYRILMENASCGVLVHDINGRVIESNKQIEYIFEELRSEIMQHNIISFVIPEERNNVALHYKKLISEKKIGPLEIKIKTAAGKNKIIELSAVSVGIGISNKNLLLTIINDITERKNLEEQSILKDKLSTIGILSAGIVHEINNPLTWITSNLKYLKKKISTQEDNANKNFQSLSDVIDETIKGTEKIQDIVMNLKGFARKDEKAPATPIDINEILTSAINMASHQIKDVAQLKTYFAENLPKLLASGNRLHQVFLNLIVNAIQSFPEESSQNIISIYTSAQENAIRIDIADTGSGISPDKLPHIFDIFFTTKLPGIGTGLGLSICYDIVNHEGGRIAVESVLGKGTVFSVYLPLHKANILPSTEQNLISDRGITGKL